MNPAEPFKTGTEQLASGIVALAVCVAQLHAKTDPSYPERLESLLAEWPEAIAKMGGAPHGVELIRSIQASLVDPKFFPKSDSK